MAIYRGPGGSGDATGDATNQAVLALASANSAATSANSAATSATSAASSASQAASSAIAAANSALDAASVTTNALQKSQNLADLSNIVTARTNLGLGTAALANSTDFALDTAVVHNTGNETIAGTKTFSSTISGSVSGSATTLSTGRTIGITGDLTYTSPTFDGSSNITGTGTLATVNATTGVFGSSSQIPVVTVNAKGLVTNVTTSTVAGGQYFGSAAVKAIAYNSNTIAENITTTAGNNSLSVGPISILSGFSVTVASGTRWVVL